MYKFGVLGFGVVTTVLGLTGDAKGPEMKKLTPILVVDKIEPAVAFWVKEMGFEMTGSVPDGDALGFAMLAKGPVEIMYQTRASIQKDNAKLANGIGKAGTCLYLEVDSLNDFENKLKGVEIVMERREMFYGMTEIGIREPGGHSVTFAAKTPEAPKEE